MRARDPRRFLPSAAARARVRLIETPESESAPDGSVSTRQCAEVTLPRRELERLWSPEYLERLARTYWRFLSRISLGVLRVLYTSSSREIAIFGRPFVVLRFHAPEYEIEGDNASVTWRIDRGVLVRRSGRGKGHLRISVHRRPDEGDPEDAGVTVLSEVANFYPAIAGSGRFSRVGRWLYKVTQYRIHVAVTNRFLLSLANLDLVPSVVGALRSETSELPPASRSAPP